MLPHKIELLIKIKRELLYGDNREIAKRSGFTEVYVSMCLSPQNSAYNKIVTQHALDILRERKAGHDRQLEAVKNL
jgi:hypothetical protein